MTLEKHKNHVQINITFKHILEENFFPTILQFLSIQGTTFWFSFWPFNIYGFSVISSICLMIAGCYLVRAQAKNDLYAIKRSAGNITMGWRTKWALSGGNLLFNEHSL